MLKLIQYVLAIQALISVGTTNPPVSTHFFDKAINFFTYTFSSLYIFIQVNNFLVTNESYIVDLLFFEYFDYLLFQTSVVLVFNFMEFQKGINGLINVLINALLFALYKNKITFLNLIFSTFIFSEIAIPFIRVVYNTVFLDRYLVLNEQRNKLNNGICFLSGIYFLVLITMMQRVDFF